ncbi:MAG: hypothetical protein V1897_02740 [Pseudomonadota bacterium]
MSEQVPTPFIWGYFDIIGYCILNDKVTFYDTRDGIILTYDGGQHDMGTDWRRVAMGEHIAGVEDSHTGLDIALPLGTILVSAIPTSTVLALVGPPTEAELRTYLWFENPSNPNNHYMTA